jgi:putative transposase
LGKDTGPDVIANSIQLTAGRTGQEYNQRKGRHGAFWEDRLPCHCNPSRRASAALPCLHRLEHDARAGVVTHPSDWTHSGYREFQNPPKRYGIIDLRELSSLCGFHEVRDFQQAHREWVKEALSRGRVVREGNWSEAIAVGSMSFVNIVKRELGFKAVHRELMELEGTYALREEGEAYGPNFRGESEALSSENTHFWN